MIENIGGILNSVSIIALSVAVARNALGIKRLSNAMVGKQVSDKRKERKSQEIEDEYEKEKIHGSFMGPANLGIDKGTEEIDRFVDDFINLQ